MNVFQVEVRDQPHNRSVQEVRQARNFVPQRPVHRGRLHAGSFQSGDQRVVPLAQAH